jgi:hypothetical protein
VGSEHRERPGSAISDPLSFGQKPRISAQTTRKRGQFQGITLRSRPTMPRKSAYFGRFFRLRRSFLQAGGRWFEPGTAH